MQGWCWEAAASVTTQFTAAHAAVATAATAAAAAAVTATAVADHKLLLLLLPAAITDGSELPQVTGFGVVALVAAAAAATVFCYCTCSSISGGGGGRRSSNSNMMSDTDAQRLFEQVGFTPPPGMSTQDALVLLMQLAQRQQAQEEAARRPGRGRTAVLPEPPTVAAACSVLQQHGAACEPISPCGCEITGLTLAASGGAVAPELAGALELLMAAHGFVLLRRQGEAGQSESGVRGQFLTGEQQCVLSECFGAGALHSTHGVHPQSPCRDIFRLSNDQVCHARTCCAASTGRRAHGGTTGRSRRPRTG